MVDRDGGGPGQVPEVGFEDQLAGAEQDEERDEVKQSGDDADSIAQKHVALAPAGAPAEFLRALEGDAQQPTLLLADRLRRTRRGRTREWRPAP